MSKDDLQAVKAAREDLQKKVYEVSTKIYQEAAKNSAAAGQSGKQDSASSPSSDKKVYDADYKEVDNEGNNEKKKS